MAREAAVVIALAPSLAEVVFGILPRVQLVEAVPTVVGVALAAPEEMVVGTVPIVAVAPTDSVGIFVVVEQQFAQLAPFDHSEGVARCRTPEGSPTQ